MMILTVVHDFGDGNNAAFSPAEFAQRELP
jgi:hypothetical protein